jgi:DNA-binding NtrC family response regulator
VRIIAATNRDLEAALNQGRFREDLYYRLKVVTISLPPLRERREDIVPLTNYFLSLYAIELNMNNPGISKEALMVLQEQQWPGNVRELANTLKKALIFNRGAPVHPEDIIQALSGEKPSANREPRDAEEVIRRWMRTSMTSENEKGTFENIMDRFAEILISEALNLTDGNRSQAARLLGLSRPTLHSKIEKYGLKFETSIKTK